MSATVEKILKEVKGLSLEERHELWERVAAEEANNLDEWEKQVERDSNSGRLDHLLTELKEDIKAGRVKPLDEVISNPTPEIYPLRFAAEGGQEKYEQFFQQFNDSMHK